MLGRSIFVYLMYIEQFSKSAIQLILRSGLYDYNFRLSYMCN
jgi:hypothetical protein